MQDEETTAIEFKALAADFEQLGCLISPAEFDGFVTGRLVASRLERDVYWGDENLEYLGLPLQRSGPLTDRIIELPEQIAVRLESGDYSFTMLLPDDDVELGPRVVALASWCEGFLVGLALGGMTDQVWASLSPDLAEGLSDIAAIAQMKADESGAEEDYMQLVEYVRMVVLNVGADWMLQAQPDSGVEAAAEAGGNRLSDMFRGRRKSS